MSGAIVIDGVHKAYDGPQGQVVALERLDLVVQSGQFVTIVGPSGCGKTTLLRLVANLERPTSGRITIDGVEVSGGQARVGMVFQAPTLLPWLTVRENVLLPSKLRKASSSRKNALGDKLIEMAQLERFAKSYPHQLSGGMQQRVGICRALLAEPDVLLMDEPFGALDAMTRDRLNLELQNLWSESGQTVLFITHSIPEAVALGDRVVVMTAHPGRLRDDLDVPMRRPRAADVCTREPGAQIERRLRDYFTNEEVTSVAS